MRRLCLTFVTTAAVLSTGSLGASALTPGNVHGVRAAVEDSNMVQQARWVCTHRWNGHWHRHRHCWDR